MARDGHLHLWTHLFNMSNEAQLAPIREYLSYLGHLQAKEDLEVEPIHALRP